MRTQQQILDKLKSRQLEQRFIDWFPDDVIIFLEYDNAKPFIKEDITREGWATMTANKKTDDDIRTMIIEYLPFAWDKANNCRGISASRSIDHFEAWTWLLGHDIDFSKYRMYGKHHLVTISELFGVDWRALDDGKWRNSEEGSYITADEALGR